MRHKVKAALYCFGSGTFFTHMVNEWKKTDGDTTVALFMGFMTLMLLLAACLDLSELTAK